MKKTIVLGAALLIVLGVWFFAFGNNKNGGGSGNTIMDAMKFFRKQTERIDFSKLNPGYRFSGEIPDNWRGEYVKETDAINIYDPNRSGASNLERSEIFIRNFRADSFLTLSTVNVLNRRETTVGSHQAVRYEIEKKSTVPNFVGQPAWRNRRHSVVDIRFSNENPTTFYVIAKNPELEDGVFENFINSLVFHNDRASFVSPLKNAETRVTKKPFGIFISPNNSPVQPEKFSGFHTGTDFEIVEGEASIEVPVAAICGGRLVQKQTSGGYGGVAVQECLLENQRVHVVYGHLRLASILKRIGGYTSPGEPFAVLGQGNSQETDGERKHLHLGILASARIDLRGYVNTEKELATWLNAESLLFNR